MQAESLAIPVFGLGEHIAADLGWGDGGEAVPPEILGVEPSGKGSEGLVVVANGAGGHAPLLFEVLKKGECRWGEFRWGGRGWIGLGAAFHGIGSFRRMGFGRLWG